MKMKRTSRKNIISKVCQCIYTTNKKKICSLHNLDSFTNDDLISFNTPNLQQNIPIPSPNWRLLYPINLRSFETTDTINFKKHTIKLNQKINSKNYYCDICLENFSQLSFKRHILKCNHIKGNLIYQEKSLAIYEFDGDKHKNYCRRLCVLGKLFIDHKTLFYDVDPFSFYVLYCNNNFVGFFSREKISNYNLSCIVVLPIYQGKGYGYFLVDLSYKLRKGTPEKPLSEQGLVVYKRYWMKKVYDYVVCLDSICLENIADNCNMTVDDVVYALELLDFIRIKNGSYWFEVTKRELKDMRECKCANFIGNYK